VVDRENCAVVCKGVESRDFDYKGPGSWKEFGTEARCQLTKDILAMANTSGGSIVIGVEEREHRFVHTGLSSDQAAG
jgi:hypothetical protein